jgi:hypothetical protein
MKKIKLCILTLFLGIFSFPMISCFQHAKKTVGNSIYTDVQNDYASKKILTEKKFKLIHSHISFYFHKNNKLPDSLENLYRIIHLDRDREFFLKGMDPERLRKDYLTDAWGNLIVYEIIDINSYRLTCYAADNKPGGEGDNIDFSEEMIIIQR